MNGAYVDLPSSAIPEEQMSYDDAGRIDRQAHSNSTYAATDGNTGVRASLVLPALEAQPV